MDISKLLKLMVDKGILLTRGRLDVFLDFRAELERTLGDDR